MLTVALPFDLATELFQGVAEFPRVVTADDLGVEALQLADESFRVAVDEDKPNKKTNRYAEEHFGFADGISQPCATPDPNHHDDVSYGEILHGYVNDKDNVKGEEKSDNEIPPQQKIANDLFKNSSFLVIRKLRQRVEEFEKVIREQSDNIGIREEVLKGKLMGRSTDGRPLVESSHIQDFDFDNDAEGKECPFQAHIRRSNPRAPARRKVPRIMRRGFAYGPRFSTKGNDAVDRGLMFMSYSASIAEQFEVIQRWISGGNSTGILSGQDDPLLGVPPAKDSPRSFRFTHCNRAARCNLGSTLFVELQWGMYLFAPSLSAIDQLIKDPGKEAVTDKGLRIIEKLKDLEKFEKQKEEPDDQKIEDTWKKVLEDRSARLGGITEAVWAAIIKHPDGTLNTPYGLLVGSAERRVAPKARRLLECGVPAKKEVGDLDVIDATTRQVSSLEPDGSTEEASPALLSDDAAESRFQDFADAEQAGPARSDGLAKQVEEARTPIRLSSMPPGRS